MLKCSACGHQNPEGTLLCEACANNLRAQTVSRDEAASSRFMPPADALENVARAEGDIGFFPQEVQALYRAGSRLAAHRALVAAAKAEPLRRARWQPFIEDLRLWLEPSSAPSMFTFNGIGARLYGSHQARPDNSYIATLYFVVLFLPLYPITTYLVAPAQGRGWYFLGTTPHGPFARGVRWVIPGLAVAFGLVAILSRALR